MPKLFDLLSDSSKKDLITEARKFPKREKERSDQNRSVQRSKKSSPDSKIPELPIPDFIAVDVETTGLDFKSDRIIEIGAVCFVDGKPSGEFSSFINAGVPIPPHITDLTGISDNDISEAPTFAEIADRFLEFIANLPLCGHQVEFDTTFINAEFKRINRPVQSRQLIDTALFSRILLGPDQHFSLKSVTEQLSVDLKNAHRALHDARASGEVAVALLPRLTQLPLHIRQTLAFCAPTSFFKGLIIKSLGRDRSTVIVKREQRNTTFVRLQEPESYQVVDNGLLETIFSNEGVLSNHLKNYLRRPSQQDMATKVADTLNTQSILIAEAGTGIGKSLAYLIPAALWALKNKCRVVISTKTRNLQDQLMSKDLPIAQAISDQKLSYSVLKGRSNYICLNQWKRLLSGEIGNLSPRERFAILPLIPWVEATQTGDIEEQNQFNPKWFNKIWNVISSESHECRAKRCPNFQSCFFQTARQKALSSNILVINHALFFSDLCSENSFLGKIGSIIFDEAHHLESSGHRHLRTELDTNRINLFLETLNSLVLHTGELQEEKPIYSIGKELRKQLKHLRTNAQDFLSELSAWASKNQNMNEFQIGYDETLLTGLMRGASFETSINEITDQCHALKQCIGAHPQIDAFQELEQETLSCLERASQLKADFLYLSQAVTDEHVFWMEGNHEKGWVKLCGVPLDIGTILSEFWQRCNGGVVFTSATLSISNSADYFSKSVGLEPQMYRTTTAILKSPFGSHQMVMGAVKNSPDPDHSDYPAFVAQSIVRLHNELRKNILVLFTSNSMLHSVYNHLRADASIDNQKLLAQGMSGARHAILDQFKRNQMMILLGTDSFWEGVDVPGEACEIIVIPRLPFPVPTHPLTQALCKRMESVNGESFFSYSVPEAVIKFRQGIGRLIRSIDDRGVGIVLDNRIISKGYGKQFLKSFGGSFNSYSDVSSMISSVKQFFENRTTEPDSSLRYVPIDEV